MEIVYRKIKELNKLDSNPRTITEEDMEVLKDSIRNNPDYLEARPLVLSDRTGTLVIIDGNQRYEACLQLGLKEVPTALLHGLTEEREREIIIRANVNNGKWDLTKLFEWDYRELMDWGVEGISFPEISDFNEEEVDDTENILRNQNYEAGAHIKYLVFEGYKIPVSEKELDGLKQRATEYMNENGVMVGFVNNLLGL
ncbi:ParB N-terminal domain-containing protein [Phocaeicola faecium]|jgi:hypothetical protein|uniref:ParB N-terminal domain-containing protein n=1 Tax=Phocaeicola faecium TaxID=2762213 RepID=A0ABR8V9V4_9BACT|nr:ParB N-terminal domain-containing protein [Phocaeicola faecium]MBD8001548.1 ParB N-terminal domain-containing protein [Phocaeicola faecium]